MRNAIVIMLLLFSACSADRSTEFIVNGRLKDVDGSIFRIIRNGQVYDTDTVTNGMFSLHARLPNLELIMVHMMVKIPNGGTIWGKPSDGFTGAKYFFVDKGSSYTMVANSYQDLFNHKETIITTSKNQKDFDRLERLKNNHLEAMTKKREEFEVIRANYLEIGDLNSYNVYSDSIRQLQTSPSPVRQVVNRFISENPNTYATVHSLANSRTLKKDFHFYKSIYARLTPKFKNHKYAVEYKEKSDLMEKLLKNEKFKVDIQARKDNGRLFDLEDFGTYKLIVIDVWASWCIPCIQMMPLSKKLQLELSFKNVAYTFLSIDEGKSVFAWQKMNSDLKLRNSYLLDSVANKQFQKQLGIETIPRYIIINNRGELLEKAAPGPDEPEKLKLLIDNLLKNNK